MDADAWERLKQAARYVHPDKRVQVNLRIHESLKENLLELVQVWKLMAEAQGNDPDDIDLSYVCNRLLEGVAREAKKEVEHLAKGRAE